MARLTQRVRVAKHRARVTNSARKRRVTHQINQWFENVVTKAKLPNATDKDKAFAARVIDEKANRVTTNIKKHHTALGLAQKRTRKAKEQENG